MESSREKRVKVFIKVRELRNEEDKKNVIVKLVQEVGEDPRLWVMDSAYDFEKVFMTIRGFVKASESVIQEALDCHRKLAVIAYGGKGSGKTSALFGRENYSDEVENGVLGIAIDAIFRYQTEVKCEFSFMYATFFVVFNEEVRDLLTDEEYPPPLVSLRDPKFYEKHVFHGLSSTKIETCAEILACYKKGLDKLNNSPYFKDHDKSKCHKIFSISLNVVKRPHKDAPLTHHLTNILIVDLASFDAIDVNVDKSLINFNKIFCDLASDEFFDYIDHNDSLLTKILDQYLGGQGDTVLVATISPTLNASDQTEHTLEFAKEVANAKMYPVRSETMQLTLRGKIAFTDKNVFEQFRKVYPQEEVTNELHKFNVLFGIKSSRERMAEAKRYRAGFKQNKDRLAMIYNENADHLKKLKLHLEMCTQISNEYESAVRRLKKYAENENKLRQELARRKDELEKETSTAELLAKLKKTNIIQEGLQNVIDQSKSNLMIYQESDQNLNRKIKLDVLDCVKKFIEDFKKRDEEKHNFHKVECVGTFGTLVDESRTKVSILVKGSRQIENEFNDKTTKDTKRRLKRLHLNAHEVLKELHNLKKVTLENFNEYLKAPQLEDLKSIPGEVDELLASSVPANLKAGLVAFKEQIINFFDELQSIPKIFNKMFDKAIHLHDLLYMQLVEQFSKPDNIATEYFKESEILLDFITKESEELAANIKYIVKEFTNAQTEAINPLERFVDSAKALKHCVVESVDKQTGVMDNEFKWFVETFDDYNKEVEEIIEKLDKLKKVSEGDLTYGDTSDHAVFLDTFFKTFK